MTGGVQRKTERIPICEGFDCITSKAPKVSRYSKQNGLMDKLYNFVQKIFFQSPGEEQVRIHYEKCEYVKAFDFACKREEDLHWWEKRKFEPVKLNAQNTTLYVNVESVAKRLNLPTDEARLCIKNEGLGDKVMEKLASIVPVVEKIQKHLDSLNQKSQEILNHILNINSSLDEGGYLKEINGEADPIKINLGNLTGRHDASNQGATHLLSLLIVLYQKDSALRKSLAKASPDSIIGLFKVGNENLVAEIINNPLIMRELEPNYLYP